MTEEGGASASTAGGGPLPLRRGLVAAALVLVLLYGGATRLVRTRIGLPYLYHWDESDVANVAPY